LLPRFVERRDRRSIARAVTAALGAVVLASCGSSTPQQASTARPTVVAPEATSAAKPAAKPAAAEPARSDKRGRKSERRDAEAAAAAGVAAAIPEAAQLAADRALAALRSQDWLQAELELEQLTHDFPDYPGPHVNLAIVYLHDGRRDDARASLDRALAIDPGHAAANNQLGILLREQGKFEDAEAAYRRALESDSAHALAHYNLGVLLDVYLRRGAEAIEHYEAYQASLAEPDKTVAGWLIDLRRRFGGAQSQQVAKENGE
jgi:tetratricopeptide (TPR) repeat protein